MKQRTDLYFRKAAARAERYERGVRAEDLEPFGERLIEQARVVFAQWPIAA